MALDAEQHRLSEADHERIFERRIKPLLFADAKAVEQPVAIVFGGTPGSGKTPAIDIARGKFKGRGGAVEIIGDDLRGFHPKYDALMTRDDRTAAFYTDRDTGRWVEKAIEHAKQQRVNLVIEGTMRDGDKVAETMQSLRSAGYMIDARAVVVSDKLSWQGVLQRYERQKADRGAGRMTAPHSHRDAAEGLPITLGRIEREKLADRVSIYRRQAIPLYSNELRNGEWQRPPAAREAAELERWRPMTLQERRDYVESFEKLADSLAKPERRATPDERRTMDELRVQARRELAAEVFRRVEPGEAMKSHPELAGAYGVVAAVSKKAEVDGLSEQQKSIVVDRARKKVAAGIERGEVASVQIRTEVVRARDKEIER